MCLVTCELSEGLIPSEIVARIRTVDGSEEEVAVSNGLIRDHKLVASFIGQDDDRVLVELPREATSGKWRIWVKSTTIAGDR